MKHFQSLGQHCPRSQRLPILRTTVVNGPAMLFIGHNFRSVIEDDAKTISIILNLTRSQNLSWITIRPNE